MTTIEETPLLRYVQLLFHLRVAKRGYFGLVRVFSRRGLELEHNLAPVSRCDVPADADRPFPPHLVETRFQSSF